MSFKRTLRFSVTAELISRDDNPFLLFLHIHSRGGDEKDRAYRLLENVYVSADEEFATKFKSGMTRVQMISDLKKKYPNDFYLHLLSLGNGDPGLIDDKLTMKLLLETARQEGLVSLREPVELSKVSILPNQISGYIKTLDGRTRLVSCSILPWGEPVTQASEIPIIRRRGEPIPTVEQVAPAFAPTLRRTHLTEDAEEEFRLLEQFYNQVKSEKKKKGKKGSSF